MPATRSGSRLRCSLCNREYVAKRRRKNKLQLVEERGGKCELCGYHRYVGALDFHHRDPKTKKFGIAEKGMTYSLSRLREEAAKCALLCGNCHAEVEAEISFLGEP